MEGAESADELSTGALKQLKRSAGIARLPQGGAVWKAGQHVQVRVPAGTAWGCIQAYL